MAICMLWIFPLIAWWFSSSQTVELPEANLTVCYGDIRFYIGPSGVTSDLQNRLIPPAKMALENSQNGYGLCLKMGDFRVIFIRWSQYPVTNGEGLKGIVNTDGVGFKTGHVDQHQGACKFLIGSCITWSTDCRNPFTKMVKDSLPIAPLVIQHNYGKSPFILEFSIKNSDFP